MSESLESKLTRLEMLYTEQDYTIQTLNDVVAQQDQEISMLTLNIEKIKDQLHMLKSELSGNIESTLRDARHPLYERCADRDRLSVLRRKATTCDHADGSSGVRTTPKLYRKS